MNAGKITKGTLILTLSSFVVKILSAIYRVPFQNIVGDNGFYVYQQIYPFYGIAVALALSGLPVFLSKVIAEEKEFAQKLKLLQRYMTWISLISLVLFLVTFVGSKNIACWMGDSQLAPLLRVVAFTYLFIPLNASLRGYFQSELQMKPTAYSQLLEQIIRVGVILFAAVGYQQFHWNLYQMGTVAMLGAVGGSLVASIVLRYYQQKTALFPLVSWSNRRQQENEQPIAKRFFQEGGLICLYSSWLVLFQLIDSFTVKRSLVSIGFSDMNAKVVKGIYDRGQPIVQLGLVIVSALVAVYLPVLTRYFVEKKSGRFSIISKLYLKLLLTFGLAASVGLACILPYLNTGLFGDQKLNTTLMIFGFTIFLMALIQGYQTIFQSQNRIKPLFVAISIGLISKVLTTSIFIHLFGIKGASLATLVGFGCSVCYLQLIYRKMSEQSTFNWSFTSKILISLFAMVMVVLSINSGAEWLFPDFGRIKSLLLAVVSAILGCGTYLGMLFWLKAFTIKEWCLIPYGEKLLRIRKNEVKK